jgi:CDP-glycerol glycerophosphotransferase
MGLDLRGALVDGARFDAARQIRRCGLWDYSVTQNAFSTIIWDRAYPGRYETLEVGYPRNDVLVRSSEGDIERIRSELGIAPGQRAVLYAPTLREYLRDDAPPLDVRRVAEALGSAYVVMARTHYLRSGDVATGEIRNAEGIIDVTRHRSIEELCLAADVLVTDYSSVMFDYAVLDRPIVLHAPDWEVYRTLRGAYFDLMGEPPGVVTRTEGELVDALISGAASEEETSSLRQTFRAKFCSLDDGRAAERVVRRVWASKLPERRPADALTRADEERSPRARESASRR